MKKFLIAAVAALSLSVIAQTASATSAIAWTTVGLNLREAPSVKSYKIATLPKHQKLKLIDCKYDYYGSPTWCKTHLGHKWGWVSAKYLTTKNPKKVSYTYKSVHSYRPTYSSY